VPRGILAKPPRFAADESRIAVFASRWLNWVDDEDETPSPGGYVNVGWLYFHGLPGLEETDHEVVVHLPAGWKAEVESFRWHMPKEVTPVGDGGPDDPVRRSSGGDPRPAPGGHRSAHAAPIRQGHAVIVGVVRAEPCAAPDPARDVGSGSS